MIFLISLYLDNGLSTYVSIEFFVQTVSVCISHIKIGIDLMIENPFFSLLCKHSLFKQINDFLTVLMTPFYNKDKPEVIFSLHLNIFSFF